MAFSAARRTWLRVSGLGFETGYERSADTGYERYTAGNEQRYAQEVASTCFRV